MTYFLGRYASVIVTTIIFVALVVSVLGINFYLSFQTEANAEVVNIAGRQRMLSQRIAKSLGRVGTRYQTAEGFQPQLDELASAATLFNTTLNAFKFGGGTQSTKSGLTELEPVSGAEGIRAVDEALAIWQPLNANITSIIAALSSDTPASSLNAQLLAQTQSYTDANINTLLRLMNDLTNFTEGIANQAAERSRTIQSAGIIASLLCFSAILYLIFGQLRVADRAALSARHETERIFETVNQGLFLVDKNGDMGSQRSKALASIFGTKLDPGQNFTQFLKPLISPDDMSKVQRYLKLLFDPHKKQRLLRDLNPLNKLSIQLTDKGKVSTRYLNFSFTRVVQEGEIVNILTSVVDITNEVKLERELEAESARNERQLEMVKVLLGADSALLPEFLKTSAAAYQKINDILKDPAKSSLAFKEKASSILSIIHKIKGESAAIGLTFISEHCHEFENEVERISRSESIGGDDFLSLTVMLDQLISNNEQIDSVFGIVSSRSVPERAAPPENCANTYRSLIELANSAAGRQGKKVSLSVAGFENPLLSPEAKLEVMSMASQLLRNALSHGVEAPQIRISKGKSEHGNIMLALFNSGDDGYRLVCEDDGNGFDFDAIAQRAVESGYVSEDQRNKLSSAQLLKLAMHNKLSSREKADDDAGRGVGLNVINDLANKLNGKVSVQTKPHQGTRFTVRLNNIEQTPNTMIPLETKYA